MKTFDQSLFELYQAGEISYEDALRHADSQNDLRLRIKLSQGGDARCHRAWTAWRSPRSGDLQICRVDRCQSTLALTRFSRPVKEQSTNSRLYRARWR
jgi:hypothetical protein